MTGRDGVAVEMKFAMDLDEGHRALVAGEHRERSRAQVLAPERVRAAGDGRYGWWPTPMRHAVALDDVSRLDAWPHHDAHLGQPGTHLRELAGEGALRLVERGRLVEELGAFAVEGGELVRPVRQPPVAIGVTNCRHGISPGRTRSGKRVDCAPESKERVRQQRHPTPNPCRRFFRRIAAMGFGRPACQHADESSDESPDTGAVPTFRRIFRRIADTGWETGGGGGGDSVFGPPGAGWGGWLRRGARVETARWRRRRR